MQYDLGDLVETEDPDIFLLQGLEHYSVGLGVEKKPESISLAEP